MMDDVGAALTGGQVDPAEASAGWDDWLQRPGNRTALLQIGLNLMQPQAIGQTMGGHVAQAVGAGGEAQARVAAQDLKEEQVDNKLSLANQRLAIAQQNADTSARRADSQAIARTQRKVGGLTDLFRARAAREDARNFEKQLDSDAKAIVKQATDEFGLRKDDPIVQKYKGMTVDQVREDLRKTRKKPNYGSIPSNDDTSVDDSEDTPDQGSEAPPAPGARLAPDGNWYRPDPANPGKWQRLR